MGYDFERVDPPWLDYRPPPQTARARINRTGSTAPKADTLFPLKLDRVVRFQVPKAKKGKADELLLLEKAKKVPGPETLFPLKRDYIYLINYFFIRTVLNYC